MNSEYPEGAHEIIGLSRKAQGPRQKHNSSDIQVVALPPRLEVMRESCVRSARPASANNASFKGEAPCRGAMQHLWQAGRQRLRLVGYQQLLQSEWSSDQYSFFLSGVSSQLRHYSVHSLHSSTYGKHSVAE